MSSTIILKNHYFCPQNSKKLKICSVIELTKIFHLSYQARLQHFFLYYIYIFFNVCRVAGHGGLERYLTENKILRNFPTLLSLAIKFCRLIDVIKTYLLHYSVPVCDICSRSYSPPKPKLPLFGKYAINIFIYMGTMVLWSSFT